MTHIQYSYQCDTNGQIIARVASDQIIAASESFTKAEHLDIVGWIYDDVAKEAYIPIRDTDGTLVLSGGKLQRDLTQSDKTIKV